MSKTMLEVCRCRFTAALVAATAIAVVLSAGAARAGVISGPILSSPDDGYQYSGLGFTATVSSTLTSFSFRNQGLADTVVLADPLGNILDSVATPSGNSSYTATVSWSLAAGAQYYLLQTTYNNALFWGWSAAAPSDAEIALTDTGDFSLTSPASANFSWGGGSSENGTTWWADFTNITTSPAGGSTTPEPASFTLVLPFAVAVLLRARRKGLVRNE